MGIVYTSLAPLSNAGRKPGVFHRTAVEQAGLGGLPLLNSAQRRIYSENSCGTRCHLVLRRLIFVLSGDPWVMFTASKIDSTLLLVY